MEISQISPASGPSPAARNSPDSADDGGAFAKLLKQSGNAGKNQHLTDAGNATRPSGEKGDEATDDHGDTDSATSPEPMLAGMAVAPTNTASAKHLGATATSTPGTPATGLSPLTQTIAQAMTTRSEADRPLQPPVLSDAPAMPRAALGADEPLDLAGIRERLTAIANAQHRDGMTTMSLPQTASQATGALTLSGRELLDLAKPINGQVAQDDSGDHRFAAAMSRHQSLSALGVQPMTTANASNSFAASQQQVTFNQAIATSSVVNDDAPLAIQGNADTSGSQSQAVAGHLAGASTAATGPAPVATPSPQVLSAPLASAQWQQGLGQQLLALHQRGGQQMELHLHPAELGPLTISLKVDDQLAQAQFFSAHPHVRAAVEQAIPQLREALEESGIQLGEAMVGEHRQNNDDSSHSQGGGGLASGNRDSQAASTTEASVATAMPSRAITGNGDGVDLYA